MDSFVRSLSAALVALPSLALAAQAQPPARTRDTTTAAADSTRRARSPRSPQSLEALTVTATRASADAPVAQTTLDDTRLRRDYGGQDVPLLLRQAPSVTAFAESGSLLNYSYIRLRGVDQSRINFTLDGVPLNEPEDQQVYFSDFPDLASSIQSVQIQRGVGTSTTGQAAFGGSVNFASPSLAGTRPNTTLTLGGGSFGTARGTLELGTGQLPNGVAVSGRLSALRSDGYRQGATSAANAAFVSGGWFGRRDVVKVTASTGLERNGQAYSAVPRAILDTNPRFNPLAGVGDRYRESFATLNYTRLLSGSTSAGLTAYGFQTGGFYDYPAGDGLAPLRYRSASRWGGLVAALRTVHTLPNGVTLSLDGGAHGMLYSKDHEFDARPDLEYPAYRNVGHKREASAFGKTSVAFGRLTAFGDVQVRTAEFRYTPTAGYGLREASEQWTFVNPRGGLKMSAAPGVSFFASFGTTGREPTRADLFAGADDVTPDDASALLPLTRVRPEHVNDLEVGASFARGPVTLTLTGYDMRFRDEIARTGGSTPLGYDLRANVGRSVRRGVELDGTWTVVPAVDVGLTAAVSRNRIAEYRDEATGRTYRDVEPILTPTVVGSHRLTWRALTRRATPRLTFTADGRYQGRSFLAPTGDERLTAPPFYVIDGGVTVAFGTRSITVQGRNLLDRFALPSGDVSSRGVARYYILAPRSVDATVRVPF